MVYNKVRELRILIKSHINFYHGIVFHAGHQISMSLTYVVDYFLRFVLIDNVTVALCHLNKVFHHPICKWISFSIIGIICHHIAPTFCCKFYNTVLRNKINWRSNNLLKLLSCPLIFNSLGPIILLWWTPYIPLLHQQVHNDNWGRSRVRIQDHLPSQSAWRTDIFFFWCVVLWCVVRSRKIIKESLTDNHIFIISSQYKE